MCDTSSFSSLNTEMACRIYLATITQNTLQKGLPAHLTFTSLSPKPSFYNQTSNNPIHNLIPNNLTQTTSNNLNISLIQDECSVKAPSRTILDNKDNGFEILDNNVRINDVEARMLQNRVDEASREAENYRMVEMKNDKIDEEYGDMIEKLYLKESEERRRKKVEELKALENSHCDYYKMKLWMQSEIAGLLERMEATNQQLV